MFDDDLKITVDMRRLRMRDIALLEKNLTKSDGSVDWDALVPIIARVTNMTPDAVWDWPFETMMLVQKQLNDAMGDIVKKTSGDS